MENFSRCKSEADGLIDAPGVYSFSFKEKSNGTFNKISSNYQNGDPNFVDRTNVNQYNRTMLRTKSALSKLNLDSLSYKDHSPKSPANTCKEVLKRANSGQKRAIQLLLFGLPVYEEMEYAKRVVNSIQKGIILGFKISFPGAAILIVPGYFEAIKVMKYLQQQVEIKGIGATLTAEEVICLNQQDKVYNLSCNTSSGNFSPGCTNLIEEIKCDQEDSKFEGHSIIEKTTKLEKTNELKDRVYSSIKLFVGCLPKSATDDMLREIFGRYGKVIDVHILRDNNANTKFSAFVYFPELNMALDAIRNLDRRFMMANANRPIEVRLAEKRCLRVPRTKDMISQRRCTQTEAAYESNKPEFYNISNETKDLQNSDKSLYSYCEKTPVALNNKIPKEEINSAQLIEYMKYISKQGLFDLENLTSSKNQVEYYD